MLFLEGDKEWSNLPQWASYLLHMGYSWPAGNVRRIALISMPCDSAAAGLIVLGALIRDLGDPKANNIEGHYDALLRYARQYVQYCRNCQMRCIPEVAGCGYTTEATGLIRHRPAGTKSRKGRKKFFRISERTIDENRLVLTSPEQGNLTWWPDLNSAYDFQVDGEPFPENRLIDGVLSADPYKQLMGDAPIVPENLRRPFSGLCMAGRTMGDAATRHICADIRFGISDRNLGLDELLTIRGWTRSNPIYRVAFFNSRTEEFDRYVQSPDLVVADGDSAFISATSHKAFQRTSVIGVIHRTLERDRLESVGNKIQSLRQWYMDDNEIMDLIREPPLGIRITALRKGT